MSGVVLTGFMGTGKTTVGQILAHRFGLPFLDLDSEIERRTERSVAQIFKEDGEAHFRRLESDVVQTVSASSDSVIATGGGTLLSEANRTVLESGRHLFCLNCQSERLQQRLTAVEDRPLLDSNSWDAAEELLRDRRQTYNRYQQIDTTNKNPEQVAQEIGDLAGLSQVAAIPFDVGSCSRILFEQRLLRRATALVGGLNLVSQVVLVTDETVVRLDLCSDLEGSLEEAGFHLLKIVLPTGEEHKSLETLQQMYASCLDGEIERSAVVIGFGGGVVCDTAGMLAATYLRGLRLVLIPTTLVAQADAAIGGKAGVDFGGEKNIVGSFYPAELVLIDPGALTSLPSEHLSHGLVEIVKVGAILNESLFQSVEGLRHPREVLERISIIRGAALAKAEVVGRDPRESGERELLNFGHTVGHALESASDFSLPHGSAVGLGMLAELHVAQRNGWCSSHLEGRIEDLLARLNVPTRLDHLDQADVLNHMSRDKKRKGKGIRFAVPTTLGNGTVFEVNEPDAKFGINRLLGGVE